MFECCCLRLEVGGKGNVGACRVCVCLVAGGVGRVLVLYRYHKRWFGVPSCVPRASGPLEVSLGPSFLRLAELWGQGFPT